MANSDHEARIAYLEQVILKLTRRIEALERAASQFAAIVRAVRGGGS